MNNYTIDCLEGDYFREPTRNTLNINKHGLHFGIPFIKATQVKIPWDNLLKIDQTANYADKRVSYGKALAGGLLFGPVGAIVGGLSGTKVLERTLTIVFLAESNELKSITFESKMALPVRNKIEKEMQKRFGTLDRTEA